MTAVLVDTSVVIKWFHATGESELGAARALRDAHVTNQLDAHILDLALYEIGNVLVRSLGWPADDVAVRRWRGPRTRRPPPPLAPSIRSGRCGRRASIA